MPAPKDCARIIRKMRKIPFFLLLLLLCASTARSEIFIQEPRDQLTTFGATVTLRGRVKDLEALRVNERALGLKPGGGFTCGLILKRGKNYIEVRADGSVKELRILSLKTFPDIEALYEGKKHWARNQIIHLATLGYVEGYPDDNFYPSQPVTRGELATWIARVKNLPVPALTGDVFFDVPKEHWRAPYIKAVTDAGFMKSYSKELFGVDDPISRREAAEVAVISEGLEVVEKIKPLFIDVPEQEKGATPIYVARKSGLVIGVYEEVPVFDPDRAMTRAEAAVLLSRFKRSMESIRGLFDFDTGYSPASFCGVNVAPEIISFTLDPKSVRVNQKSTVRLRAEVASRQGFAAISNLKVDLSEIGGLPDTEMFDDGTHGDEVAGDLVYSLNISLEPKESGSKILTVSVVDRLGWESNKPADLLILE